MQNAEQSEDYGLHCIVCWTSHRSRQATIELRLKCRALGPMYSEIRHKTIMIPGKTKIFQRDLFEKIRIENFK